MTARTLFALLLTAGVAVAQDPAPTAPAPTPAVTPPAQPTPATTQPMATILGAVTPGTTVAPMTGYPYQPGQVMPATYSQPAMLSGTPAVAGYTYPGYGYTPGTVMTSGVIYPRYGYMAAGSSTGYAYPSFANGYANSTVYGTPGGGRRWFRR